MICCDCQKPCRNRCPGCNQPYCAACRDTFGHRCLACRGNRQRRSPSSRSQLVPPGGFQPNVSAPPRLPLSLMDDAEFASWQARTIGALEQTIRRTENYLAYRKRAGRHTPTDAALEQDLVLYADLLDALRELGALRPGGTSLHSGNTGLLLMAEYDDGTPRPKP